MKLKDIVLLSLSAAMVIIGTHLTITQGLTGSYPVFMLAVALLFWYQYRKYHSSQEEENKEVKKPKASKRKKRR